MVMDTPTNPKRPCLDVSSSSSQQNPNSYTNIDSMVSAFHLLLDSDSPIPSLLDPVLGQVLSPLQDGRMDRTSELASYLHEYIKPLCLKRASLHNNKSWSLPYDLTIKVFSMLDTKSMIRAASCCTMLQKWAKDPLCYAHIDLIMAENVSDNVMCSIIRRAGKELRALLETLQLHKLGSIENEYLCALLSACPNLKELKIVDFDTLIRGNSSRVKIITQHTRLSDVLQTLTRDNSISKLKHLFLEVSTDYGASGIDSSTAEAFVASCPDLTSLTLIGFELEENIAQKLIKGFPKLKYMNLSKPDSIGPYFLRSLGDTYTDNSLETLILQASKGQRPRQSSNRSLWQ